MSKGGSGFGGGGGGAKNFELTSGNSGGYLVNEELEDSYRELGLYNGGETDQWMLAMDYETEDAFKDYSSDSDPYNDFLRGKTSYISDERKEYIDKLEESMYDFNLEKPMVFHRGSGSRLLGGADTLEKVQAMIGKTVRDKAFVSTSATRGKGFSGIRYHIMTPPGRGIGAFMEGLSSYGSDENEFLFNHHSVFKVVGAYIGGENASYKDRGKLNVNLVYLGRDLTGWKGN